MGGRYDCAPPQACCAEQKKMFECLKDSLFNRGHAWSGKVQLMTVNT